MEQATFEAHKETVRERLSKFTAKVFQMLLTLDRPRILDLGCGSGVSTMKLAACPACCQCIV
jgi:predicted O-methyltransferase YrrM